MGAVIAARPRTTALPRARFADRPLAREARPSLVGAVGIWALLALAAGAILFTYARLPAEQFPPDSPLGLARGARRALKFLNFPVAPIALAIAAVAVARLTASPAARRRGGPALSTALLGAIAVLTALPALPGLLVRGSLDVAPVNAFPVLGVLLALGLTVRAVVSGGPGTGRRRGASDRLRLGFGIALVALALPWVLADLGVSIEDVPVIGRLAFSWQTAAGDIVPAVHLGHHHGMDGTILALAALTLLPESARIARSWLRRGLAGYLSLMLVYGAANAAEDFWLEQIVRRGWAETALPDFLWPAATPAWGAMLLAAAISSACFLGRKGG